MVYDLLRKQAIARVIEDVAVITNLDDYDQEVIKDMLSLNIKSFSDERAYIAGVLLSLLDRELSEAYFAKMDTREIRLLGALAASLVDTVLLVI